MRMNVRWLWLVGTTLLWGCGSGEEPPPSTGPKITLRVPLYPYIPDAAGDTFKALTERIEAEFEESHPNIDLVLNPSCFQDDFYDPAGIALSLNAQVTFEAAGPHAVVVHVGEEEVARSRFYVLEAPEMQSEFGGFAPEA